MLVFPLISFRSSISAYLKVVTCFYTIFTVEIVLKVLINAVYINVLLLLLFAFLAVSVMGHMTVVSSAC